MYDDFLKVEPVPEPDDADAPNAKKKPTKLAIG